LSNTGLTLKWVESVEIVPPKGKAQRGFGMTIIEASARQLNGSAVFDWLPQGLRATISIPGSQFAGDTIIASVAPSGADLKSATRGPSRMAGARVLVVEDEAATAIMIKEILLGSGCIVHGPEGDLAIALESAQLSLVDVALLDLNLGGASSLPVARALEARSIPFGLLSGYSKEGIPSELKGMPYLSKPFDRADLITLVEALLTTRSMDDSAASIELMPRPA
jgi:CheY-like chemotaxis protein